MKINRFIIDDILKKLHTTPKAIIIYGPRQVGKTTLCQEILKKLNLKTLSINADVSRHVSILSSRDDRKLRDLIAGYELLFIDEAQRIPDIGINLKILIDQHPSLKIITTGSSSFELANTINEPLTGRKWTYHLYPISILELSQDLTPFELKDQLEERLIWGAYPALFNLKGESRRDYLRELCADYLYKDLLSLVDIRHSSKIQDLLKLLAFQIGNEISLNELGNQLDMSKETVARYLDLLEKTFIVFSRSGFSRNLRKEVTKMKKYYFYDVGIRNGVIENFNWLSDRNDVGELLENFLMVERLKRNHYQKKMVSNYFWRTYTGVELDCVEEGGGQLRGFEFKWKSKRTKVPPTWKEAYPNASFTVIDSQNWLDFVL